MKSSKLPAYFLKADLACAICMRSAYTPNGAPTGIEMKACSACKGPRWYCSDDCFKKDWTELGHKEECKLLSADRTASDAVHEANSLKESKETANTSFKAGKYKEAIKIYTNVKIGAIRLAKFIQKRQKQENSEQSNAYTLPEHLFNYSAINLPEKDLKIRQRHDPFEWEMIRLSAICANNTAVSYNKLKNGMKAAAAALEALRLDAQFIDRIMPQLLEGMKLCGHTDELRNMQERSSRYRMGVADRSMVDNSSTMLFLLLFISYNQNTKLAHKYFYETMDAERSASKMGTSRFQMSSLPGPEDSFYWGKVVVRASIVPIRERQWITLGIETVKSSMMPIKFTQGYVNMRVRPVDLTRSADEIDATMHPENGSISHAASFEALKNSHREIILFVNDIEREGGKVVCVDLGAGLFNLLPTDDDPQKEQRKHKGKAEKYVLYPGHFIPEHCRCKPSDYHVRADKRDSYMQDTWMRDALHKCM